MKFHGTLMRKASWFFAGAFALVLSPIANSAPVKAPPKAMRRAAEKEIREALVASTKGDTSQREKLLYAALEKDPTSRLAHWSRGDVLEKGSWRSATATPNSNDEAIWTKHESFRDALERPKILGGSERGRTWYREKFVLSDDVKNAVAHVASTVGWKLTVNGREYGLGRNEAGLFSIPLYDALQAGVNVVAFQADGTIDQVSETKAVRIWIQQNVSEGIWAIGSSERWKATERIPKENWGEVEFDDSGWSTAQLSNLDGPQNASSLAQLASPMETEVARWCSKNHLASQARYHWSKVLEFDSNNREALEGARMVRVNQQIVKPEEAKKIADDEAQARAAREKFFPEIKRFVENYLTVSGKRRDKLLEKILAIHDPAAIPSFREVARRYAGKPEEENVVKVFVEFLGGIDHPVSTDVLTAMAIENENPEIRTAAAKCLQGRDLTDFVPGVMQRFRNPEQMAVRLNQDARTGDVLLAIQYKRDDHEVDEVRTDVIRFQGQLSRDGARRPRANDSQSNQWVSTAAPVGSPSNPFVAPLENVTVFGDLSGATSQRMLNSLVWLRAQTRAAEAQRANETSRSTGELTNSRCAELLEIVTGKSLGKTPNAWSSWWKEYNDLHYPEKKALLVSSRYGLSNVTLSTISPNLGTSGSRAAECFAKGTPVWTRRGVVGIETIRVGDEVLSQDVDTGELGYKLVTRTTIRPKGPMTKLDLGSQSIVSTRGHRYWKNGDGWRMAKHLTTGDSLSGLGGIYTVRQTEEGKAQEAYNLVVEDFHTYFVGTPGILVHDVGAPRGTSAVTPGLSVQDAE